ncbi:FAD-binding oxidoreductase [bacterium]|nr:FAD-binding oxidoreductase [bacterium]
MPDANVVNMEGKAVSEELVREFKGQLRGKLIRPKDEEYNKARAIWNAIIDRRPSLIVRCSGVADVIDSVNFAREHKLLVAVRGGGHNVAGNAVCDDGMVIDLSEMRGVRVDPKARTARVAGGATWGDIDRETQAFGLATPGGLVSTTGVGGFTLGGGLGILRNKHGLTIDNLISADIVTADGSFLQASETENADLFWAIRGGGGNFGVVTAFEFRLHTIGPLLMVAEPAYPIEDSVEVVRAWRDFMTTAPDEVSSQLGFWSIPEHQLFPPEIHGKQVVFPVAVYSGPVDEGKRILQPLRELGKPLLDMSEPLPYSVIQSTFDAFFPQGKLLCYWKSLYLSNLDDDVIEAVVARAVDRPSPRTIIPIWHIGGAVSRVGATKTAFGDRGAPFLLSIDTTWTDPAESEKQIAWTREFWQDMKRYSTGGMYFNFPGLLEEGDEMLRATFGANYDRLVTVKKKYDPENLFRLNQNIKPN